MKRLLQQIVLPGVIFQSVLIGGAYATGREIVEYGGQYGSGGLWSLVAIGFGFSVVTAICYEFARVTRCFDYRSLVRELIGPLWPLFDLLYVTMVVVVIAVVSAASGAIGEQVLGLPYVVGVTGIIVLVAAINASGRATIERFKSIGSVVLYAGYALFAAAVIGATRSEIGTALSGARDPVEGPGVAALLGVGLLYAGYNLSSLPSTLFVLDRQTARWQALTAGLATGLLSTVPFLLTYLAVLGFYPDAEVLGAQVPWLVMLEKVGGGWQVALFAIVVMWTLVETSVGMIHAITDRMSANLEEVGRAPLTPAQAGGVAVAVLLSAALLSRLGIIALVAQGYTLMAYGFLALFALPLLTRGLWRIARSSAR
ncbi:MAG: hypothetical protein GKS06_15090 [Acidobacteria bacterium]|nr:hypothetical protein [Acidobacteriota bacterium]